MERLLPVQFIQLQNKIQVVHGTLLLSRPRCLQFFCNVPPSEMARKNGVTSDTISDTPVTVGNQ